MLVIFLLFLFIGFLSIFGQMIMPDLPFFYAKAELSALFVIYFTLRMPFFYAFGFSLYTGMLSDLLIPGIFGTTTLSLILLFLFMSILKPLFAKIGNYWMFPLYVSVGIFFYSLVSYLLFELENHQWYWSLEPWTKCVSISFLSTLVSIPLFLLMDLLFALLKIPLPEEEFFPSFFKKNSNLS
jgi:rod shape-determining protein MreD